MWNEKGASLIESLFVISILFVLMGFLPFVYQLQHSLYNKTLELHASEVAYEGVRIAKTTGISEGTKWIDHVEFRWTFQKDTICVHFTNLDKERLKCIDANGEYETIETALH